MAAPRRTATLCGVNSAAVTKKWGGHPKATKVKRVKRKSKKCRISKLVTAAGNAESATLSRLLLSAIPPLMASFVGSVIVVTLKQGAVIQGFVHAVDPTSASIVLHDAFLPNTGQPLGSFTAQGQNIADLQVVQAPPPPSLGNPPPLPPPSSNHGIATIQPLAQQHALPPPQQVPVQQEQFEDPAILSYARKPNAKGHAQQHIDQQPTTAVANGPQTFANVLSGQRRDSVKRAAGKPTIAPPIPSGKPKLVQHEEIEDTDEPDVPVAAIRRVSLTKTRTGKPMDDGAPANGDAAKKKGKKKKAVGSTPAVAENEGDGEAPLDVRRGVSAQYKGKGWRQTPMLQEPTASSPRANDGKGSIRRSRKQKAMEREAANNGWATEDATDIQELGEFDFASNLSKFDKRSVFNQIRNEDTTADEERLVHYNRNARPGTYGGKNYHPTENVLDSPKMIQRLSNHESDSDAFDSGRASRRINSRASSRRPPYRSNSGALDESGSLKDFSKSGRTVAVAAAARSNAYAGSSSHGIATSPNPQRYTPPESPANGHILGAHFRISTTNRACPTIMPAGMAAIEEVAETEFGLTTEIMTENAGRGIAEVAMATINTSVDPKRSIRDATQIRDTRPWALIIAGNHRSGARALAACRHLRSRNIRTLTCLLGFDRQTVELEREVRKQADILVKMSGYVRGWNDTKNYLAREAQPDLIIDALMASSKPFDVLAADDQKAVVEITNWTRKLSPGKGVILSVDMPCGINGSTGEPSVIDSTTAETLHVNTNHVVFIGAPRIGLLRALQKTAVAQKALGIPGATSTGQYSAELLKAQIWVVDIGVEKAWKRSGLGGSKGIKFGADWVLPIKLVEGAAEEGGR